MNGKNWESESLPFYGKNRRIEVYEAIMINRIQTTIKLVSKYQPSGDQPQAIEQLVDNIEVEKRPKS